MVGAGVALMTVFACLIVYNTYKYFYWPHVQAVVISIEPICVHTKKTGRRSRSYRRPRCDDSDAAARLVADGYKFEWKEARIEAAYERELGGKASAILTPYWEGVSALRPGSVIPIRYSPFSPNKAELVTRTEKVPVVILGFFLGALALSCLLAFLTYEGDEEAAPGG